MLGNSLVGAHAGASQPVTLRMAAGGSGYDPVTGDVGAITVDVTELRGELRALTARDQRRAPAGATLVCILHGDQLVARGVRDPDVVDRLLVPAGGMRGSYAIVRVAKREVGGQLVSLRLYLAGTPGPGASGA